MTKTRGLIIGSTGVAVLVGVALLFVSPQTPAQTTTPTNLPVVNTISVTGYQLVGAEKRISRTVSEFTYRVTVRNSGPALIVVSGRASASSSAITFPDNTASFGDIASGTPANSTDTFTIRQDRSVPFNVNQLSWQFIAAPGEGVPPDPGVANNNTLAGIDSDNDGVRDDIERWIALTYPRSAKTRAGLQQYAIAQRGQISSGGSRTQARLASSRSGDAVTCLGYLLGAENAYEAVMAQKAEFLNTRDRWQAHRAYDKQLSGMVSGATPDSQRLSKCEFDVAALPN